VLRYHLSLDNPPPEQGQQLLQVNTLTHSVPVCCRPYAFVDHLFTGHSLGKSGILGNGSGGSEGDRISETFPACANDLSLPRFGHEPKSTAASVLPVARLLLQRAGCRKRNANRRATSLQMCLENRHPGWIRWPGGEPRVVVIESSALATSLDGERGEPCIDDARSSGVAGRAGGGGAGPSVRISRGYHAACGYAAERKAIVFGSLDAAKRGARTADH